MSEQSSSPNVSKASAAAAGVLLTLGASQFLMTLDSSVMNVSMATVANDLDTTVTGLQTAKHLTKYFTLSYFRSLFDDHRRPLYTM